jgi:very-short-patch-repair endonuclease
MTLPEVLLWNGLRGGRLEGLRFRRQHPFGPYILDFYCEQAKLAVEVDGMAHRMAISRVSTVAVTLGWPSTVSVSCGSKPPMCFGRWS